MKQKSNGKAKKRGRPPKPKGEVLGDPTPIRFQEDERTRYEELAGQESLSLSEWVRKTLKEAVEK